MAKLEVQKYGGIPERLFFETEGGFVQSLTLSHRLRRETRELKVERIQCHRKAVDAGAWFVLSCFAAVVAGVGGLCVAPTHWPTGMGAILCSFPFCTVAWGHWVCVDLLDKRVEWLDDRIKMLTRIDGEVTAYFGIGEFQSYKGISDPYRESGNVWRG